MREELKRQSFLGSNSDRVLADSHVAVVGAGGGGSHVAQQLAHVGIGTLSIFDGDIAKAVNMNRLIGATQADVRAGATKVAIAERLIRGINEKAVVHAVPKRWQDEAALLREADIVIGCVDSFGERGQLESAARRFLTPYIDIGMDVHDLGDRFAISGQVALSMPGRPCLRCMKIVTEESLEREQYGAAGAMPQVVWPNGLLASAAVGIAVELLTPWFKGPRSVLLRFEGNSQELVRDRWLLSHDADTCLHHLEANVGDAFFSLR
jgi:molybdopterin/thiamine biosynthesis adenylyltransferase